MYCAYVLVDARAELSTIVFIIFGVSVAPIFMLWFTLFAFVFFPIFVLCFDDAEDCPRRYSARCAGCSAAF